MLRNLGGRIRNVSTRRALFGLLGTIVTGLAVNFFYDWFAGDDLERVEQMQRENRKIVQETISEILKEQTDDKQGSQTSRVLTSPLQVETFVKPKQRATNNPEENDASTTEPISPTNPENDNLSFAVFEGQEFELCGYTKFTATMSENNSGDDGVYLSSGDRRIPDIPFRGFEKKLPFETATELWPGCMVVADYVDVAGTVRYVFTVKETDQK